MHCTTLVLRVQSVAVVRAHHTHAPCRLNKHVIKTPRDTNALTLCACAVRRTAGTQMMTFDDEQRACVKYFWILYSLPLPLLALCRVYCIRYKKKQHSPQSRDCATAKVTDRPQRLSSRTHCPRCNALRFTMGTRPADTVMRAQRLV